MNQDLMEPRNFKEAQTNQNWIKAMDEEINALNENHAWDIVDLSQGANIVGSRRVYKIKRKSDGTIDRFKARLVAQGYNYHEGINFIYSYSLVVKPAMVRCVLGLAISHGWKLSQIDVRNAFLNDDINELVFMRQPPGFEAKDQPNKVCKL